MLIDCMRTAIERTQTHALAVRRILQHGRRWISDLRGAFKALRSFSFSRTLHQDPEKSLGVADVLLSENHLSLLAAAHVPKHEARSVGNGQKCIGEIQNV